MEEKEKKTKKQKVKKEKSKVLTWVENIVEVLIVVICVAFSIMTIANPGGIQRTGKEGNYDYSKTNVNYLPVLSNSMSGTFEKNDLIFANKVKKDKDGNYPIMNIGDVVVFVVDPGIKDSTLYLNTHRIVGYYYEYKETSSSGLTEGYNSMFKACEDGTVTNAETAKAYADSQGWTNFTITGYKTRGDNKSIYYVDGNVNGELKDKSNTNVVDSGKVALNEVIGKWNGKKMSGVGGVISWVKTPLNFFLVIMIPLILLFLYNIWIIIKYVLDVKTEKAKKLALEQAKGLSQEEEEEIKRKAVEEYMKKMGIDPSALNKTTEQNQVVEEKEDTQVVEEDKKEEK